MDNVVLLNRATAWAYREHNLILATETLNNAGGLRQRTWRIRAKRIVLATGSEERMLVFPNNDRPGVMLASSVERYVNRFAVCPGRRAVVFTNNDSAYSACESMIAAGIEVAALVDVRPKVSEQVRNMVGDTELLQSSEVVTVRGRRRVRGVSVRGVAGGRIQELNCDLVAVSGGWNPAVQLWSQSRSTLYYCSRRATFIPGKAMQNCVSVGAAKGDFALGEAIECGSRLGRSLVHELGFRTADSSSVDCTPEAYSIQPYWHSATPTHPHCSFVDIFNDVTLADVQLAVREGYTNVELVKRYTTAGMGLDQGRTGNLNVVGAIAHIRGMQIQDVGVTTFRSPTSPVSFGSLGMPNGPILRHYRTTPVTQWNRSQNAIMYEAGAKWRRPGYYPLPGESMNDAVNREARAVREGLGIYDGSPLGKFEVKGPDAEKFLNLLYTNDFSDLPIGMGKYGIMLTEDGRILDDGVSFRLGKHRFLMSTSTGNAELVNRHITKLLSVDFCYLEVLVTETTCQWANATICGPLARQALSELGTCIDVSNDAFPFMAIRDGTVADFPARVARVSFTGELSFEINVRPRDLGSLWHKIMRSGSKFGIVPVGSETNHVLRVEKGFLSLGHEVDSTVDPIDLRMPWIFSLKKADFIGKKSVYVRRKSEKVRKELVGLLSDDPGYVVPEGSPIIPDQNEGPSQGFVTASVWSVANERSVALALLERGSQRLGETVNVRIPGKIQTAEVVAPCFYDPKGKALRS